MWYLGKDSVNFNVLSAIQSGLTAEEFEILENTDMPTWVAGALAEYGKEADYA